jgi:membrane-associated phospholipid phosphatase
MLPFSEFLSLYIVSLVAAMLVGLALIARPGCIRRAMSSVRQNGAYALVLLILPLVVLAIDFLDLSVSGAQYKELRYTGWFMQISGGTVSALQMKLNYGLLIDVSILFYVWIFTFVSFFSPAMLLMNSDGKTFRRYSVAMIVNYLVLIPFYVFFPVGVTSSSPASGVAPLLYVHPNWGRLVTSIDPLNNGFPSGHTSLIVTTLLIFALSQGRYRGYTAFLSVASIGIVVSVLHLGVHWPPDVIMGVVVAIFAVVASRSEKVQATFSRLFRVSRKTPGSERGTPSPGPVAGYAFDEPMRYPKGQLSLSSYSHQFVIGRHEEVPVILIPGSIRMNQTLYIHHTNQRRAEADEIRQALPVRVRGD